MDTPNSLHPARAIYNDWVDAMVCPKNDVHRIVDLYHSNAVLVPTFSPIICTTREDLNNYFKNLIVLPELTVSTEQFLSTECNDTIINSGLYTFQYKSGDKIVTVPARFTFVYKKDNDRWLIINHHSSQLPIQPVSF
jgi:hypothetical protein